MESFTAGLISLEDAQHKMLAQLTPITESLELTLPEAAGRITACAITSPIDVPPFNNAAMDGYAVRLAEVASGQPLRVAVRLLPARRLAESGQREASSEL